MDAAEEQPGAEGVVQQGANGEVQGLAACSHPQEEALQTRQKRHLSRSLDLSRGSVSSRAAKHQKQGETALSYWAYCGIQKDVSACMASQHITTIQYVPISLMCKCYVVLSGKRTEIVLCAESIAVGRIYSNLRERIQSDRNVQLLASHKTFVCIAADDGSVQYLAAPVDPAELAAATLAHQASLDMSAVKDSQPRQVLSGRDAGSLNQRGAPLNGSSHSQTAAAVRPAAQPPLVHAAGAAQRKAPLASMPLGHAQERPLGLPS